MGVASGKGAALMLAVSMIGGPVMAQDGLPDSTTIPVPEIVASADPKVQKEGDKFFFFYNPSVSFTEAHADITECRGFLPNDGLAELPSFRPWVEPVKRGVTRHTAPYGLVGAAMAAILLPRVQRGAANNKLRRCMEPRGYIRYAIVEADWDKLNEGEEATIIAIQAKLASGPQPSVPELRE
jgi:hypothetical protein